MRRRKASHQPPVPAAVSLSPGNVPLPKEERPTLHAPKSDWMQALWFLLSLALVGLQLWPVLLLTFALMVKSWRKARYHFMIQLYLLCSISGFINVRFFSFRTDILMIFAFFAFFAIPKRQIELRRTLWLFLAYAACLFAIALTSTELITIQLRMYRYMLYFFAFLVPLYIFRDREFSAKKFFETTAVYALIICAFYFLDGFVFRGWVMVPGTVSDYELSRFTAIIAAPFNFSYFPRKYPPGLFMLLLLIYPLIHFFRFDWKQWALVAFALLASRTMTLVSALVIPYLAFYGKAKQVIKASVVACVLLVALFYVDRATGSFMRVASTVEQFTNLEQNMDREELAQFGSARMAQIIPKMEMLYEKHRQWLGFGFIHPTLSKSTSVQLSNDLYSDVEKSDENASGTSIEEAHFQTILSTGYLGLIIQTLFYFGLYFVVRRLPLAKYYLCTLVAIEIFGFGGFTTLNNSTGLLLAAWSYAVVLLAARPANAVVNANKRTTKVSLAH